MTLRLQTHPPLKNLHLQFNRVRSGHLIVFQNDIAALLSINTHSAEFHFIILSSYWLADIFKPVSGRGISVYGKKGTQSQVSDGYQVFLQSLCFSVDDEVVLPSVSRCPLLSIRYLVHQSETWICGLSVEYIMEITLNSAVIAWFGKPSKIKYSWCNVKPERAHAAPLMHMAGMLQLQYFILHTSQSWQYFIPHLGHEELQQIKCLGK